MMTLVSILMPVYNAEKFIVEAIQSLLNQTYTNIEIIIVDDGSEDETVPLIKTFDDKRIQLILLGTNQGVSKALNFGLSLTKGEYIVRMDADDISHCERVERQFNFMNQNPQYGISGTLVKKFNEELLNSPIPSAFLRPLLLNYCPFVHPSIIIRRSILESSQVKYKGLLEDFHLWMELSWKTEFGLLNEILLKYRITDHQVSKTQLESREEESFILRKSFSEKWLKRKLNYLERKFMRFQSHNMNPKSIVVLINLCEELIKKDPWNNLDAAKFSVKKFFLKNFYGFKGLHFYSFFILRFKLLSAKEKIDLIKKSISLT